MAKILIVGGGFSGVVTAEALAKTLGSEHDITLVSRSRNFLFYPALVRLAFGQCEPDDIVFDISEAMVDRRVRFVEGEVARINPYGRRILFARGDFLGEMPYDFLVLALGRRLKTEQVIGFFEHAHHVLGVRDAKKFGEAAKGFDRGRALIGHCPGARLPVPVFETAFALSRMLQDSDRSDRCKITIVSSEGPDEMFGGIPISQALTDTLNSRGINLVSDFPIHQVTPNSVLANDGRSLNFDLNMLIPPFGGPGALVATGLTDAEGYVRVDTTMRVKNAERIYAAGDCVAFKGPKLGHMAVRQAEVVAENLAAEIQGKEPTDAYDHELMLVVDAGAESIFAHKHLWEDDEAANIHRSRFWSWAKRQQEHYWKSKHA